MPALVVGVDADVGGVGVAVATGQPPGQAILRIVGAGLEAFGQEVGGDDLPQRSVLAADGAGQADQLTQLRPLAGRELHPPGQVHVPTPVAAPAADLQAHRLRDAGGEIRLDRLLGDIRGGEPGFEVAPKA